MTRSTTTADSLIRYSRYAVINEIRRNNDVKRILVVRVAPSQCSTSQSFTKSRTENHLVGVSVSAKVLVTRVSIICDAEKTAAWNSSDKEKHETELVPLQEFEIKFENQLSLFGIVPIDYYHIIDKESPFYELNEDALADENLCLEFVVFVTATVESTGATYRTKQSYIQEDIKWGFSFEKCIEREFKSLGKSKCGTFSWTKRFGTTDAKSHDVANKTIDFRAQDKPQQYVVDYDKFDHLKAIHSMGNESKQELDAVAKRTKTDITTVKASSKSLATSMHSDDVFGELRTVGTNQSDTLSGRFIVKKAEL